MTRKASTTRNTNETKIELSLDIDGKGETVISTKSGFLDHMLTLLGRHSLMDININCDGDIEVDDHHTTEDCAIAIGECIKEALGDKAGIYRYGFSSLPLDEALVNVTIDFSGRPYFVEAGEWPTGKIGTWDAELASDFFQALSVSAGATLHIEVVRGRNAHHVIESAFKGLARAIRTAVAIDPRENGVPSSKGVL